MMDEGKMKIVYTVVERGNERSFWVRIGVAFTNRDGSMNVKLDAVPVNGTLQIRDYVPRDREAGPRDGEHAPRDGENGRADLPPGLAA